MWSKFAEVFSDSVTFSESWIFKNLVHNLSLNKYHNVTARVWLRRIPIYFADHD